MPRGGTRPGAGRPPKISGVREATAKEYPRLPGPEYRALGMLRHRVPPDAPRALAEVADYAFVRIVDVMNEQVDPIHATNVLKAAGMIRDEVCGPVVKKIEMKMGLAEMLARAAMDDDDQVVDAMIGDQAEEGLEELGPDPEERQKKALGD